jgi:protein-tyrosine phosphatase
VAKWEAWVLSEIAVLFVCTGNICRSPTAEGVVRERLAEAGLAARVAVDSAGLEGWHAGDPPDPRAIACAVARGYDLTAQRARQLGRADFGRFALILGMDRGHVSALRARQGGGATGQIRLFLDFLPPDDPQIGRDVPDPYYGDMTDYELSLDLIERATPGLIEALKRDLL